MHVHYDCMGFSSRCFSFLLRPKGLHMLFDSWLVLGASYKLLKLFLAQCLVWSSFTTGVAGCSENWEELMGLWENRLQWNKHEEGLMKDSSERQKIDCIPKMGFLCSMKIRYIYAGAVEIMWHVWGCMSAPPIINFMADLILVWHFPYQPGIFDSLPSGIGYIFSFNVEITDPFTLWRRFLSLYAPDRGNVIFVPLWFSPIKNI